MVDTRNCEACDEGVFIDDVNCCASCNAEICAACTRGMITPDEDEFFCVSCVVVKVQTHKGINIHIYPLPTNALRGQKNTGIKTECCPPVPPRSS